jgi:hypothetical protein
MGVVVLWNKHTCTVAIFWITQTRRILQPCCIAVNKIKSSQWQADRQPLSQHSTAQYSVTVLRVPAFPQDDSSAGSIYSWSTLAQHYSVLSIVFTALSIHTELKVGGDRK